MDTGKLSAHRDRFVHRIPSKRTKIAKYPSTGFLCWAERMKEWLIKIRQDEALKFKVGNGVDCEEKTSSLLISLSAGLINTQPNLAFDLVTRRDLFHFIKSGQWSSPRMETGDVSCLPPVWNLRAVIWFHFAISSLVLLPGPVTLYVLSFSASQSILLNFFWKILQYFSLKDRLFLYGSCFAAGEVSWSVVCASCCHMALVFAVMHVYNIYYFFYRFCTFLLLYTF